MDMIIMLDGSGSLWSRRGRYDRNFQLQKKYTMELIKHSTMDDGEVMQQDADGKYPKHVRIGVVHFASRAKEIHELTGKKKPLLAKVNALRFRGGWTNTHKAMQLAMGMLQHSYEDRSKTIMTITDGRPTFRKLTYAMTNKAKDKGFRLVTVPVGFAIKDNDICQLSSVPCSDNVEKADKWEILISQLPRFMAGSCPYIVAR